MGKAGRPTKYKPEFNEIAYKLCSKHGYTDEELADSLNVAEGTIQDWKAKYPDFLSSIKKGKAEFDDDAVQFALHKRATGFTRRVEKTTKDGVVDTYEEVPPDTTACIFWLKNRRKERWKDKHEVEHSGDVSVLIDVGEYDDEPI